ncbi:helix-turn-helix transcriptional regulator [Heyndrickxia oleronia]|uniref:helix-turn-helix domain-containing protein n=1 Tax=Heyndrickxia TaxID=2837504 RepID=UPI0007171993|nr:helix-turn-helix transcriptional regulator [Heyndrickxia oleronia]NYV66525.1 helix-turn-helix transcriptional regulator [Bacillus sp. Gen3]
MIYFKIDELRKKRGLSRRAIAKELDIRQDTFNNLCRNEVITVRIEHIEKLINYFECSSMDELIDIINEEE